MEVELYFIKCEHFSSLLNIKKYNLVQMKVFDQTFHAQSNYDVALKEDVLHVDFPFVCYESTTLQQIIHFECTFQASLQYKIWS